MRCVCVSFPSPTPSQLTSLVAAATVAAQTHFLFNTVRKKKRNTLMWFYSGIPFPSFVTEVFAV